MVVKTPFKTGRTSASGRCWHDGGFSGECVAEWDRCVRFPERPSIARNRSFPPAGASKRVAQSMPFRDRPRLLKLTFETLEPLISGHPEFVPKLTVYATANGTFLKRHPAVPSQKRTSGYWLL
jgi:hypothetical protein